MRFTFVTFSLLALTSCAFLEKQIDYQKACMSDPTCLESAKKDAELGRTIANAAYPAAGIPVGAAILAVSLWFRGRKKEQKNG